MWVSEPFYGILHYPMILLVVVWYFLFIVLDLFEKVSFVIVTAFFIYYLIYIFVLVAGPQFYSPRHWKRIMWRKVYLPSIGDYFHHHQELFPSRSGP